jgi:hypothetical protein
VAQREGTKGKRQTAAFAKRRSLTSGKAHDFITARLHIPRATDLVLQRIDLRWRDVAFRISADGGIYRPGKESETLQWRASRHATTPMSVKRTLLSPCALRRPNLRLALCRPAARSGSEKSAIDFAP